METHDRDDDFSCSQCGTPIAPSDATAFAYAGGHLLCFTCARSRGGIYDPDSERWTTVPDVGGV